MTGPIQAALADEAPAYTGICLEFGTVPLPQMIRSLRADHWLHKHAEADATLAAQIRADLRAAFDPDTDAWKRALWTQGLQATQQTLAGLPRLNPRAWVSCPDAAVVPAATAAPPACPAVDRPAPG